MNAMVWRVIAVAIVIMASCQAMDQEEGKQMLRDMANECQKSSGATNDDVTNMIEKKLPESQPAKCLSACMMEQFDVLSDGKFNPPAMVELAGMATDNDEKLMKLTEEMADSCKAVEDADKCELALKLLKCLDAEAIKRGIKE